MNTTPRTTDQIIVDTEKKAMASGIDGNDRRSVLAYQVGYLAARCAELEAEKCRVDLRQA